MAGATDKSQDSQKISNTVLNAVHIRLVYLFLPTTSRRAVNMKGRKRPAQAQFVWPNLAPTNARLAKVESPAILHISSIIKTNRPRRQNVIMDSMYHTIGKAMPIGRPRSDRGNFTPDVLDKLIAIFNVNPYPNGPEKSRIARELGL